MRVLPPPSLPGCPQCCGGRAFGGSWPMPASCGVVQTVQPSLPSPTGIARRRAEIVIQCDVNLAGPSRAGGVVLTADATLPWVSTKLRRRPGRMHTYEADYIQA